jgi:peptidoglycan/xylan/chitin deacetylase (PgdA/CDA1 family)
MDGRRLVLRSASAAFGALPLVLVLVSVPRAEPIAASFDRGRRDLPALALTFDGGSDAGETERILEVLGERGVTATFFLTGGYIRHNPALVRRIVAAGHEVGNHTWSHPHLTDWDRSRRHTTLSGRDRQFLQQELLRTAEAFEAATGRAMAPLWRAPYGEVNGELLGWAAAAGWHHVGWTRDDAGGRHTLDSLDWVAERSSRNYLTSAEIGERILSFGGGGAGLNGGIVLMHLSTRPVDPAVGRLAGLIDELRAGGCRLVTVSGLREGAAPPTFPVSLTAALDAALAPGTADGSLLRRR